MTEGQRRITVATIDALDPSDSAALDQTLRPLAMLASEGDRDALELLLRAITVHRLAEPGIRRVLIDGDDVDETAQNVLIAVAEHIGSFRGDGRFTSWLFGVGRNKALEHLRRKRDTVEMRSSLGESARMSSMIASDLTIQQMLEQLPPKYATAVRLRDLDGRAYSDIAETLDLNLNTVRAHIARGRALLAAVAQRSVSQVPDAGDGHG